MSDNNLINNNNYEKTNLEYNMNNLTINHSTILNNGYNNNEFIELNKKIEWKHFEQIVSHIKPDIERIWFFIQKLDILFLVHNQGHYPLIFLKGNDTKKVGNQFRGNLFGFFPFVAKVNKNKDFPEFKKIEWLLFIKNKYYMSMKIELMKVTEDNSTSIIETFKFDNKEIFCGLSKLFEKTKSKIYNLIEKMLENEPINLVIYESGLINGKMEDIWDIITDFNKLSAVAPNNSFPSNINLRKLNKGKKEEFSFRYKNVLEDLVANLVCKEEKPGWNKWLIICEFSQKNSETKDGSLLIQLTKISNKLCQLTLIEKFFKAKNAEEIRELSDKIKYTIISIKDYFDNFFPV